VWLGYFLRMHIVERLNAELTAWMQEAHMKHVKPLHQVRAIISPHAGYRYCGKIAAHAYAALDMSQIDVVYILGPSHHIYLQGCALSSATALETPFGNLSVGLDEGEQLNESSNGLFTTFDIDYDIKEHSLEMQYPFLAKSILDAGRNLDEVAVVPIVVGNLENSLEVMYGNVLSETMLKNPRSACIISSDFAHWGKRFQYMRYTPAPSPMCQCKHSRAHHKIVPSGTNVEHHSVPMPWSITNEKKFHQNCELGSVHITPSSVHVPIVRNAAPVRVANLLIEGASPLAESSECIPIFESIERMDREAMHLIERVDGDGFRNYLEETGNTVCGRTPISILLSCLDSIDAIIKEKSEEDIPKKGVCVKFQAYAQSSSATSIEDSSVSYASATAEIYGLPEIENFDDVEN
jgi:AmmeMemoRadiSam system protein B